MREELESLRELAGGADFVLDCEGRLSPGEASRLSRELERFHLLWLLAGREGPVTKEEILDSIWAGAQEADINRLEKTVQRLREDLGRDGPRLIRTLPGGYELKA